MFNFVQDPGLPTGDPDLFAKPDPTSAYPGFPACFANDLPAAQGAVAAATQRPIALGALNDESGVPAWKTIPSWALIGTVDRVITPAAAAQHGEPRRRPHRPREGLPPGTGGSSGRRGRPHRRRRPRHLLAARHPVGGRTIEPP